MIKRTKRKPVNYRIGIMFFSLVPVFVILCLLVILFSNSEYDRACLKAESKFEKAVQEVNLTLVQGVDFSNNIITNHNIESIFFESYDSVSENYEAKTMMDMFFYNYKSNPSNKVHFCIYHNNYSMYRNQYSDYISSLDKDFFNKLEKMKDSDFLWTDTEKFFFVYKYRKTGETILITEYGIEKEEIDSIIKKFDVLNNDGYNYQNEIIIEGAEETHDFYISKTLVNGKTINLHIPDEIQRYIYVRNLIYFILAFIFIVLFVFWISGIHVKEKRANVYKFVENLLENKVSIYQANSFLDKKDVLYPVYQKILELLEDINKIHLKNSKITEEKNLIEIKYVQSKFNPHLLYNTLSVLKWKCIKYDKTLAETIDSMADYYRACISESSDSITITEEIQLVKKYIGILEFTHEREYPLHVEISEDVLSFTTVKHIIQPFVENAILHGIQHKKDGFIHITGEEKGDFIILRVCDNGRGMTPQKIQEIESLNYFSAYKSYGIKNTQERIKIFHGEKSEIKIESKENEGTCITIMLQKSDK